MRKLRANPHKLVIELNKIDWGFSKDDDDERDIDDLEQLWTKNIVDVLNVLAPKKERSLAKAKKIKYPDFVHQKLQILREMRQKLD